MSQAAYKTVALPLGGPAAAEGPVVTEKAFGGGLEGGERTARETAMWNPSMGSPDQIIGRAKPLADARGRDMAMNDGLTHGAVAIHKDSIVGSHYRLNAAPDTEVLAATGYSFDDVWAEEFQKVVEARFNLIAESDSHWLDAGRQKTLTAMVRLAVGGFVHSGEVLATGEWLNKDRSRPLKTAVQQISPARLSNPNMMPDDRFLRRGVVRDIRGRPLAYHIRMAHPAEQYDSSGWTWKRVEKEKPWGRQQVLHIYEPMEVDQSRGVADMVAALKHMRMTKTLNETTLQNAVIQASYAAALEADMPPEVVLGTMGGSNGSENFALGLGAYMSILEQFFGGANNIKIDGAKIPVLPPGVKLNAQTLGTPGTVGSNFEESLLRYTAAALGISYEEFARDFSKVSYSSARASMQTTNRFMRARKKVVADRFANFVYGLYLEEDFSLGNVPLPRGLSGAKARDFFYAPLVKEALSVATWIGAGAGQIDELKETQAAIMRIKAKLSTYEVEIARFGNDWRKVFAQAAREAKLMESLNLTPELDAQRPGAKDRQNTMADDTAGDRNAGQEDDED